MPAPAIFPTRRKSRLLRRALSAACLAALVGCATVPPSVDLPEMPTWDDRQAVLGGIDDWQFKGRIAVKAGDEGFNGKITWRQNDDDFAATVGGPLGIGTVKIEGDDRRVLLTDKDGVETELVDVETELYFRYGWTIPVKSLRYWGLGIPDPALPGETEVDGNGHLVRLQQSGWVVSVSRYREAAGQELPRILTATNPDTRVRMVFDKWWFFER